MNQSPSANEASESFYKKALSETISDDAFSDDGLTSLTQTLADNPDNQLPSSDDIKNVLLDTLDDGSFDDQHVDFYPDNEDSSFNREGITESDDWESQFDGHEQFAGDIDEDEINSYIPGRYKVNALLDSDESGQTFSIQDNNLERNIAVKFIHADRAENIELTQAFIEEAKTVASIYHPGILPIHDLDFTDGGLPYYTLRKLSCPTLEEHIDRAKEQGPNSIIHSTENKLDIILNICIALRHAHQKGIVHGDIKPGNIAVGNTGDYTIINWRNSSTAEQRNDKLAKIAGTPMYMSPEQARKERCDEQSDIYCLGSTMLHLFTNRYPLYDKNPSTFWELKKQGHYQKLSKQERAHIPPALIAIIEKSLAPNCKQRYHNIDEMYTDLHAAQYSANSKEHSAIVNAYIQNPILSTLLLALAACALIIHTPKLIALKTSQNPEWTVSAKDNFSNNKSLGDTWTAYSVNPQSPTHISSDDVWYVKEGTLRSQKPETHNAHLHYISFNKVLNKPVRINWTLLGYRDAPQTNFFFGGNPLNGYIINLRTRSDNDKEVRFIEFKKGNQLIFNRQLKNPLTSNKTYSCTLTYHADHIVFAIGDERVIDYIDPIPLHGTQFNHFGFEGPSDHTRLDDVVIEELSKTSSQKALSSADSLLRHGFPQKALDLYNIIIKSNIKDQDVSYLCQFKSAHCLWELNKLTESITLFESLLSSNPNHRLTYTIHCQLTTLYAKTQQRDKLVKHLNIIQKQYQNRSNAHWMIERYSANKSAQQGAPNNE